MWKLAGIALVSVTACTDDAQSYSDAVGIEMKLRSGDVDHGMLADDKQITTESANPYGTFVNDAEHALAAPPSAIEVDRVELRLLPSSTKVTHLDEVFADLVEIDFTINDTGNTYVVAQGRIVPGSIEPLALDVLFDSTVVDLTDYQKLLDGSFKVIVRGAASTGFDKLDATADLETTFTFAAFE
jgi:hypothetical protein